MSISAQQWGPSPQYHGDKATVHSEKHGKSKTPEEHYELPSLETLHEAGELMIKDEYGKEVPFKSLYEGKKGQQLIIFIRHFFCGVRTYPSLKLQHFPSEILSRYYPSAIVPFLSLMVCSIVLRRLRPHPLRRTPPPPSYTPAHRQQTSPSSAAATWHRSPATAHAPCTPSQAPTHISPSSATPRASCTRSWA